MIARKKEMEDLRRLYDSGQAELVVVYGRRRIGKTYLINHALQGLITFKHAGVSPAEGKEEAGLKSQLEKFNLSLQLYGVKKEKRPETWSEAFFRLEKHLQSIDDGTRQVVFLDELPWMDTPKSGFVTAFEHFWNSWGCGRDNLMVVICGSANSWINDKLIQNKGGLYNRLTYKIELQPFSLKDCEDYLKYKEVMMSRYDIAQAYMILGGVPYYYSFFRPGYSLAQNIDALFFVQGAFLKDEYDRLFGSVFTNPEYVKKIVALLYKRRSGYQRSEILKLLDLKEGETFSNSMRALCASGFVKSYHMFGTHRREVYYKLIDPFCHYYLRFINSRTNLSQTFWQDNITGPSITAWRGLAFEDVCFCHIDQIKKALEIRGVSSEESAWSHNADDEHDGTQIDLIIVRKDNIVNMCEMKFVDRPFSVDRKLYEKIIERASILKEYLSAKQVVHSTLITTFGMSRNEYSGAFSRVITIDDLFER